MSRVVRQPGRRRAGRRALGIGAAALLLGATPAAAQGRPLSLEELLQLRRAKVGAATILGEVRRNCLAFAMTDSTASRLRAAGFDAAAVRELRERACMKPAGFAAREIAGMPAAGIDDAFDGERRLPEADGECALAFDASGYRVRNGLRAKDGAAPAEPDSARTFAAGGACQASYAVPIVDNMRVETELSFLDAPGGIRSVFGKEHDGCWVGVGKPREGWRPVFTFNVDADGGYTVRNWTSAGWQTLSPRSENRAIAKGRNTVNRLALDVDGKLLWFWANGQRLGYYTLEAPAEGQVVFGCGRGYEGRFARLTVKTLRK